MLESMYQQMCDGYLIKKGWHSGDIIKFNNGETGVAISDMYIAISKHFTFEDYKTGNIRSSIINRDPIGCTIIHDNIINIYSMTDITSERIHQYKSDEIPLGNHFVSKYLNSDGYCIYITLDEAIERDFSRIKGSDILERKYNDMIDTAIKNVNKEIYYYAIKNINKVVDKEDDHE